MASIIDTIKNLEKLKHLQPASPADVSAAEKQLGLNFAPDYKAYTQAYGAIQAKDLEFTGVGVPPRLNVVAVTLEEREMQSIPASCYVLEDLGIEGLLVLQDSAGTIYEFMDGKTNKIAGSMAEYVMSKK